MIIHVLVHSLGGAVEDVWAYADYNEADIRYWEWWKDEHDVEWGDDEAVEEVCCHSNNFIVHHSMKLQGYCEMQAIQDYLDG